MSLSEMKLIMQKIYHSLKRISLILLAGSATLIAPIHRGPLVIFNTSRNPNVNLHPLDIGAVCLSEQIKTPNYRHRLINSLGILTANAITCHIGKPTNPKLIPIRLIGANLGELIHLCTAIKNGTVRQHFSSLSKRDLTAFFVKLLLISRLTLVAAMKVVEISSMKNSLIEQNSEFEAHTQEYSPKSTEWLSTS